MKTKQDFLPASARNGVAKRDRGVCTHCGTKASKALVSQRGILQFFDAQGRTYQIDRIVPVSQGGDASMENLQLSCYECRVSRPRGGAKTDLDVQAILEEFA